MTWPDRIAWSFVLLMTVAAIIVDVATAQMSPPPSLEDRLDQCNAEKGTLITEAARLNYQLREAGKALAAEGFTMKEGRWVRPKKDDAKEPEKK